MGYTDILNEARVNPKFQHRLNSAVKELERLEGKQLSQDLLKRRDELVLEIYRACDYNPGFLVPYYFPHYIKGNPLSLRRRPFAFALYAFIPSGFLVVAGSRQISKSTNFAGRQLINGSLIPGWGSMYVAPHSEHLNTYATRLREMEMSFRFYRKSSELRQNLKLKELPNGGKIELVRALTTAAHIRGKSTDELIYDEYQLFDVDLEGEISQTQKASDLPVTIYAGTATTVDSPLADRYDSSSKATWWIKDGRGRRSINCGDKDILWKCMRPEGFICPWTSKKLDVVDGMWIHEHPERLEMHRVGFHVPQVIIPEYVYDYRQYAEMYRHFVEDDPNIVLNEIFGIPVEQGAREITAKDLEAICVLGPKQKLLNDAKAGLYRIVFSAFDWGGSDHQQASNTKKSYTVHTLMGITHEMELHILDFRRYAGMAYADIVGSILQHHFAHQGGAIASDFGGGQYYNTVIRQDPRVNIHRHLIFNYSSPFMPIISAPHVPDPLYNQWDLNKTEALSALFAAIKDPRRPIKCFEWGEARNYLLDFLNAYRVPTELLHGKRYFRYIRPPSKSDDSMQAVNFGFALSKLLTGQPLIIDPGVARELGNRLGANVRTAGGAKMPARHRGNIVSG